ncbi:hypothetical protein C8R44DRAFT_870851 [Mycena epipterygia]|nr:hypothetical protein C8R44DRAFT_870851 [Mycena epipterygia]
MDKEPRPLVIQELLDHCIGFLGRPSDLKACALASRSWTYAAQLQLFRAISITSSSLWWRLKQTLDASPHLIQYIRRLEIYSGRLSVSSISNFPFTRVEHVFIEHGRDLYMDRLIEVRQLLSWQSLRRVHIQCAFMELSDFLHLWDCCAPGIRHLHLDCLQRVHEPFYTIPHPRSTPITLDSLRIKHAECVVDWLMHDLCPFDLSCLKVLSIHNYMDLLRSPKLAPSFRTIQAFDFQLLDMYTTTTVDLSLFPQLGLVRMWSHSPNPLPMLLHVLATIGPTNRIHTIIICATVPQHDLPELDEKLSRLPMHHVPTVELEMRMDRYNATLPLLPQLSSRSLIRRTDYNADWFNSFTGMAFTDAQ